jgi:uncharacterized 2Fe-2S/4Fe-4S cluster protein (DUF4445 family)
MGMRAVSGAISEVAIVKGAFHCRVIGGGRAKGICGSGLVDAVAAGLEVGAIQPSGRLAAGAALALKPPVSITQRDIRELQLAKGAIAAGLDLLLRRWGASAGDLARVYLAGAFGNYINRASAQRIGLLNVPPDQVEPAGNTALRGAKMALFQPNLEAWCAQARAVTEHVSLNEDMDFEEAFVEQMTFPERA